METTGKKQNFLSQTITFIRTMSIFAVLWWLVSYIVDNPVLIPSPVAVLISLYELLATGELIEHITISLKRLMIGYILAVIIGVPLGMLMGISRVFNDLFDSVVEMLRPISGIAWIPIGMFIFGVGDNLAIFIISYATIFPVIVNTFGGVRTVDRVLVQSAQTMGVNRWNLFWRVIFPATLPNILVGLRIAMGLAWVAIVASELIGTNSGLGFAVEWYRQLIMTSKVVGVIIVIGVLGYVCDLILRGIQKALTPWEEAKVGGN